MVSPLVLHGRRQRVISHCQFVTSYRFPCFPNDIKMVKNTHVHVWKPVNQLTVSCTSISPINNGLYRLSMSSRTHKYQTRKLFFVFSCSIFCSSLQCKEMSFFLSPQKYRKTKHDPKNTVISLIIKRCYPYIALCIVPNWTITVVTPSWLLSKLPIKGNKILILPQVKLVSRWGSIHVHVPYYFSYKDL